MACVCLFALVGPLNGHRHPFCLFEKKKKISDSELALIGMSVAIWFYQGVVNGRVEYIIITFGRVCAEGGSTGVNVD